ncbi:MAG: RCC1 domain-containing protein [Myxococcaceae bacterium]
MRFRLALIVIGGALSGSCFKSPFVDCASTADCPHGACRKGICAEVRCPSPTSCEEGEVCADGKCIANSRCSRTTCGAQGRSCGSLDDGCGGVIDCGTCIAPQTCGGGGAAGVCGCTPETDQALCGRLEKNCGTAAAFDNCGAARTVACGSCSAPLTCGRPDAANVCCTPTTCAAQASDCGAISDGCTGTIDCGTCVAPKACGGDGTSNMCGCCAAVHIAAGGQHTCIVDKTGGAWCWGTGSLGQLGDGTLDVSLSPRKVAGLDGGLEEVVGGSSIHSCAKTATGGVKCWGSNLVGQLGDGTTENRPSPVDVVGLTSNVLQVAATGAHSCALLSTGGVKCWGLNVHGELGDGTTTSRSSPVGVTGLSSGGASALGMGGNHSCAVTYLGGVVCWGWNTYGQLGDGTTIDETTPTAVQGLSDLMLFLWVTGETGEADRA